MKVQIFDVEHGGCALVTADNGARMLIDCGSNSSTGWRPSTYVRGLGATHLERLFITNYDEDHASDLPNLRRAVTIGGLYSNPSVSGSKLKELKKLGGIGAGIDELASMKSEYNQPITSEPYFGTMAIRCFFNRYPTDFTDENNLSLVVIIKCHGLTICFPGDMEVDGWKQLMKNPSFIQAIKAVNVLVASHHGRRNGCCEELFSQTGWKPAIVVISDAGIQYATQETIGWYGTHTGGMEYNGVRRHVFTTRHDGRVLIEALPTKTTVDVGV